MTKKKKMIYAQIKRKKIEKIKKKGEKALIYFSIPFIVFA